MKHFRIAVAALTILIVVFAAMHVFAMFNMFTGGIGLDVHMLDGKPEKYFVVTQADSFLSKAIADLSKTVSFNSFDETQIDDLISHYGTHNFQYGGSYYSVQFVNWDGVTSFGSALWTISLVGLTAASVILVCLVVSWLGWKRKHTFR